jgi:hypothetical protein
MLFFKKPQVAVLRILGLIPPSQIREVLRCASLQIENPHVFLINQQTRKISPLYNSVSKGPKILFKTSFYFEKNWIRALLYALFVKEKKVLGMYLRTCESFKTAIRAQVRKLQNHTLQIRNHKKRLGQQQQQNLFLRQKYFGSVLFYDVPILCHK